MTIEGGFRIESGQFYVIHDGRLFQWYSGGGIAGWLPISVAAHAPAQTVSVTALPPGALEAAERQGLIAPPVPRVDAPRNLIGPPVSDMDMAHRRAHLQRQELRAGLRDV